MAQGGYIQSQVNAMIADMTAAMATNNDVLSATVRTNDVPICTICIASDAFEYVFISSLDLLSKLNTLEKMLFVE